MKKTELKMEPHTRNPSAVVIELWYDGKMIGTIYGKDGPGIRVISKYPMHAGDAGPMTVEVEITPRGLS